jgi:hypothetical protein
MSEELTIHEELKWVYIVKRGEIVWGEYFHENDAVAAIARIKLNEQWARKKNEDEQRRKAEEGKV